MCLRTHSHTRSQASASFLPSATGHHPHPSMAVVRVLLRRDEDLHALYASRGMFRQQKPCQRCADTGPAPARRSDGALGRLVLLNRTLRKQAPLRKQPVGPMSRSLLVCPQTSSARRAAAQWWTRRKLVARRTPDIRMAWTGRGAGLTGPDGEDWRHLRYTMTICRSWRGRLIWSMVHQGRSRLSD